MIRMLNEKGIAAFEAWIMSKASGAAPTALLTNSDTSAPLPGAGEVAARNFNSKYELATYLSPQLAGIPRQMRDQNRGLWSWLALFFNEALLPVKNGKRRVRHIDTYITSNDFRRRCRHLVWGPVEILQYRSATAEALLSGAVHQHQDYLEQLASRKEYLSNNELMLTAVRLYFTQQEGVHKQKTGAVTRGKPGNLRRLVEVMNQFSETFDLFGMMSPELMELLPAEFKKWIPA